ncbi:MAG: carboxypeptidase-like regulatory domain-containing protein, partial [Vicinamibacterales bacterium]|nr:carboxypeptidase-like regulatory domain-containing protein [Vicinamibacterales bacterium]
MSARRSIPLLMLAGALLVPVAPAAQSPAAPAPPTRTSPVRVVVMDQTGAIIVGATLKVTAPDGRVLETVTDEHGEARLDVGQGDYTIEVSSVGFDVARYEGQRVRGSGGWRREVILEIADFLEEVEVRRDPREAATDPAGSGFTTTLSQSQIDALPDDPDELEAALQQMAGPGATFRVNGFRNSGLPPKSQIREIRFRQNAYAADSHEASNFSVDITTQPGKSNWRTTVSFGYRNDALDARNAFAQGDVDESQRRGTFSIDGPLWKDRTSIELNVDGFNAYDVRPVVAILPSGPFTENVRRPSERAGVRVGVDHALSRTQTLRLEFDRRDNTNESLGIGDLDLPERAFTRTNEQTRVAVRVRGPLGRKVLNDAFG